MASMHNLLREIQLLSLTILFLFLHHPSLHHHQLIVFQVMLLVLVHGTIDVVMNNQMYPTIAFVVWNTIGRMDRIMPIQMPQ